MSRIQYEVTADTQQVAEAVSLFEFVGGNTSDAIRIAINKTAPKVKTQASRAIRDQVRLAAAYVGDKISVRKATRARLNGAILTESRGLLLSRFSTDASIAGDKVGWFKPPLVPAGGIKVKVKPDGAAKLVTGDAETAGNTPFYLVLNSTHNVAIAARIGRTRKVKVFHGPSISQVFNTVRGDILPAASDEYQAQLLDAMRYLLVKQYPPEAA